MKYLGIDFGASRVGVAVSDEAGNIAFPRGTLPNDAKLLPELVRMIEAEHIGAVIVGDTRTVSGRENPVTAQAEQFIAALAQAATIRVDGVSEAWSSIEASRYAPKGHEHDDAAAAAIILQRFLDMHGGR